MHQPAVATLQLASRELAPIAAALCLMLGPVFHRSSLLTGGLLFVVASGLVLVGTSAASHTGVVAPAPGALLAAVLLAFLIGTLTRRASAADGRTATAQRGTDPASLMPALAEGSTAAILTFDSDGRIRSCNRALGEMFGYAAEELVGTSFGRLLEVPEHDQPRLFRRSDGPLRALIGRRRNGQRIQLHASLSSLEWRGERVRAAILYDVAELLADHELSALSDDATGLCNRVLFHDRIDQAILAADRTQQPVAVFVIHLALFKLIADTLGQPFADELIGLLVGRIQEGLRRSDTLARLGDAELGLLVPGLARPEQAAGSARRIAELAGQPFAVQGLEVDLAVNIGVAVYPQHGHDKHALIQRAEAAMLRARRTQRAVAADDEPPDGQDDAEHELRDNLRAAIEHNLLTVQFLPKLSLKSGRLVGVEALARWEHPQHGQVATERFLRLAEETGLILPLTLRVLSLALDQQRIWRSEGWDLAVAINLANGCLQNPQFPNILTHDPANCPEPGRPAGVRDHRKRACQQSRPGARNLAAPGQPGLSAVARRFRHGIVLAVLPAQAADSRAQDRSLVRPRHAPGRGCGSRGPLRDLAGQEPGSAGGGGRSRGRRHPRRATPAAVRRGAGLPDRAADDRAATLPAGCRRRPGSIRRWHRPRR